jgi:hypothetical protein
MKWRMPVNLDTAGFAKEWCSNTVRALDITVFMAQRAFGEGWMTLHLQQYVEIFAPDVTFLPDVLPDLGLKPVCCGCTRRKSSVPRRLRLGRYAKRVQARS